MKKIIGKYILAWKWLFNGECHITFPSAVILWFLVPVVLVHFLCLKGLLGGIVLLALHYIIATKFVEACQAKEQLEQNIQKVQNIVNVPLERVKKFFVECINEAKK
jgi:hypothetical protein